MMLDRARGAGAKIPSRHRQGCHRGVQGDDGAGGLRFASLPLALFNSEDADDPTCGHAHMPIC